ncbi:phospholipid carrier-dependent glycosyltransferase [Nannocystis sp. SCPEA4]|uniref:ArnT family glycosyltransferase n=1 Tax=Nannocystis sp. SCPEA4 TaxID=2996787 RepID=UPI00226D6AB6|nr:glycosyltransferase family 39 protein [Nannocystis sp. SCPEA4]
MQRALDWLYRNRWPLVIVLGAFLVRLHWNLVVHPLGDYVSSDMKGYVSRADQMIDKFGAPNEYHAFFPYGTHFIIALVKALFGKDNFTAIGVAYALMGTGIVAYAYRIAARISPYKWVPPLLGTLLVFYYPLISLGGYTLSEVPFGVFMMMSVFYLLRLVQEGKSSDAWLAGVTAALATACRPQILLSIALFGVAWLVFRKQMPRVRWRHLVYAGIPLILVLGYSAARMHHHTGRIGLVSENGKFNQLFGRCHNKKATATPTEPGRGKIRFGPPPLIQLEKRAKTAPRSWVQLEPALGPELEYRGYIADAAALDALMAKCIRKTGFLGQVKYGIVNMLLLAGYNTPWPDSGRDLWRPRAIWWQSLYTTFVTLPVVLGLSTLFMRRTVASYGLIAIHVLALMITAAIYFGDTRLRAPYDPLLLLLAFEVYIFVGLWAWKHGKTLWQRWRARRA